MRRIPQDLRHTHTVGSDTVERIVAASGCPALRAPRIVVTGLTDAGRGYRMVRERPQFEQLTVCVGGRGHVLVDGNWRACRAGQAYLQPPLPTHAFRTVGRQRWRFCWIIYETPEPGVLPRIGADRPRIIEADPRGIWAAIDGLHQESVGPAEPSMMEQWVRLIESHAARILNPLHPRDPLWRLWAEVASDPGTAWSLDRLADHAWLSAEHVRRLCLRHTGRSPMENVTHLRMARASALLESTPMKIAAIAQAVGYGNPFAFSTAFRRITGVSPAAWRRAANRPR